jgi:hypothetical protein
MLKANRRSRTALTAGPTFAVVMTIAQSSAARILRTLCSSLQAL